MDLNIKDMDKCLFLYSLKFCILCFVSLCPRNTDAAYFPNYGYVGCYNYTNHMDKFKLFNATPYANESLHSCIQTCLKEYNKKYAGIMADKQCYCGDKYNQTFATTEEHCNFSCSDIDKCGGNGKISIYNTDYDVKPLFSIPGNNTKFLEVWNRKVTMKFGNMFTGLVMRSPSIDWWNQTKPYHRPEYVSMMALNQHGQVLWAIDFVTNDTNATIEDWMTKDRVLPNEFINSSSIETLNIIINTTNNEIRISESESDYVWFHRGNVNNDKAIVTVVSPKKIPLPVFYTSNKSMGYLPTYAVCTYDHQKLKYFLALNKTECNCSNDVHGNCIRYFWKGDAVCPWQLERRITGCCCCPLTESTCSNKIYENATEWMNTRYREIQDTVIFERNCQINCTKSYQEQQWNEKCLFNISKLQTQEPNYGMRRVQSFNTTLEVHNDKYVANFTEEKIICGINLTSITNKATKIELIITDSDEETIEFSNDTSMQWFNACFRAKKLTFNVSGSKNRSILTFYELADDALLMVDRIAVLGFYHKEEPKVSKWEFLNDYSPEEVLNIMRPVLQKARSAGEVAVRNLSSSIRKKESATDYRKSSKGIGILGSCLLGLVFLIIFVSDVFIIKAHLKAMYRNVLRLFRPSPIVHIYK